VSGSSCTVVPFPLLLDADRKYLVDEAINGSGDVVLLNEDVRGRLWFFAPDATYRKTAVVALYPDRITRCRGGLCIYSPTQSLDGADGPAGVFFCDDDVAHCKWAPVPNATDADGDLLRGTALTPTFLSRTEFPPTRASKQQVIYQGP
jgi:hypothetical protein